MSNLAVVRGVAPLVEGKGYAYLEVHVCHDGNVHVYGYATDFRGAQRGYGGGCS